MVNTIRDLLPLPRDILLMLFSVFNSPLAGRLLGAIFCVDTCLVSLFGVLLFPYFVLLPCYDENVKSGSKDGAQTQLFLSRTKKRKGE